MFGSILFSRDFPSKIDVNTCNIVSWASFLYAHIFFNFSQLKPKKKKKKTKDHVSLLFSSS